MAQRAAAELGDAGFLYVIEDFEPLAADTGTEMALAEQSYAFAHRALFATASLRDYFCAHRLGVFADGAEGRDQRSAAFEPPIAAVRSPSALELSVDPAGGSCSTPGAGRRAAAACSSSAWLPCSRRSERDTSAVGNCAPWGRSTRRTACPWGAERSLRCCRDRMPARTPPGCTSTTWACALSTPLERGCPAIEMAAAGLVTVTNSSETNTAEAMTLISPNLVAQPPTISGIVRGLGLASARAEDFDARVRGSRVGWSRDWNESFPDQLIDRVAGLLGRDVGRRHGRESAAERAVAGRRAAARQSPLRAV